VPNLRYLGVFPRGHCFDPNPSPSGCRVQGKGLAAAWIGGSASGIHSQWPSSPSSTFVWLFCIGYF